MNAIQKAVAEVGLQVLADSVGVRYQAVQQWVNNGKPPLDRCAAIEAATGIRCDDLRPDVQWLRADDAVIGYVVCQKVA